MSDKPRKIKKGTTIVGGKQGDPARHQGKMINSLSQDECVACHGIKGMNSMADPNARKRKF